MTAKEIALKKSLQKRLDKISKLCKNGLDGESGSDEILKKVYEVAKNENLPFVSLDKLNVSIFDNGNIAGFVKTQGGFIVAKIENDFLLFKGRSNTKLLKEDRKKLEKNLKAIDKQIKNTTTEEYKQLLKKEVILKEDPLNKESLLNLVYDEYIKPNPQLMESIINFLNFDKNKISKTDFKKNIRLCDLDYLVSQQTTLLSKSPIRTVFENYSLDTPKTSFTLKRNTEVSLDDIDKTQINKDVAKSLQESTFRINELESMATVLAKRFDLNKEEKDEEKRSNEFFILTKELTKVQKEADSIKKKLDNIIPEPNTPELAIALIQEITENADSCVMSYKETEVIKPKELDEIPIKFKRVNIKNDTELFAGKKEDEKEELKKKLKEKYNVEPVEEDTIYNYGVFTDVKSEIALKNLVTYAKSLSEIVNEQKEQKQATEKVKHITNSIF